MIFNVGVGGASNAESIKYDNSLSGLEATNVQGAVDEVNDSLVVETYTSLENATINANSNGKVTITIPNASEYIANGYTGYILTAMLWDSSVVSNPLSVVVSATGTIDIIYINNYSRTSVPHRVTIMWKK